MEPQVIYEDPRFLALSKPAGLLVHGIPRKTQGEEPTVVSWLLENYPEVKRVGDDPAVRPGIVHRLDKETSGVLLVPRSQAYFEYLKQLFKTRKIKKTYLALVSGKVKEEKGTITAPIGFTYGSVKRSIRSKKDRKEALTDYKVIERLQDEGGKEYTLLSVFPKTGRTHQIRVHLKSIGHPIVGDRLYGGRKENGRLMLHALSVEFPISPGRHLKVEAEPPDDFKERMKTVS